MPTVDVNGTDLEYTDDGSGPPVVFVHGSLSDLRNWSHQVGPFSSKYRTVTFSCRHYFPNKSVPDSVEYRCAARRTPNVAPDHGEIRGAPEALGRVDSP